MWGHMFLVLVSLCENKHCIGPTMTFRFQENITLPCFLLLRESSSRLSFTVGFFRTFYFLSLLSLLEKAFQLAMKDIPCNTQRFSWLQKIKHRRGKLFGFHH